MAMEPQAEQASGTRWRVRTPAGSVRLILAACGAGLAAVVFGIVMARAGGGGGFMAPMAQATVPGSPGDTTADLVLGQLNFTNNTANLVDGLGFDMLLPEPLRYAVFGARRGGDRQERQSQSHLGGRHLQQPGAGMVHCRGVHHPRAGRHRDRAIRLHLQPLRQLGGEQSVILVPTHGRRGRWQR